jgi:flagellar hook assembly protein FlgD
VPEARAFTVRNYPNPFNPSTKIEYYLPVRDELTIKIYDLRGELVRVLVDELREAGPGFVIWDGSDGRGQAVASGIYFHETRAQGQTRISKMALVK